jgi:hypothetical protein
MVDLISSSTTVLNRETRVDQLHKLLLSIGGNDVARHVPDDDLVVSWVLEGGFCMAGRIVPRVMQARQCHMNMLSIWKKGYSGLVGIGTGWGLSSEREMWIRHSWGVLRDGILESTPWGAGLLPDDKCDKRFGIVLQGNDLASMVIVPS